MLYYDLKIATKDIDMIVDSSSEFTESEKILKQLSFHPKALTQEYLNFDLNQQFIRDDFQIDLFQQTVCKKFKLSKNMKSRAEKILEFDKLSIYLCSTTDIFMFKTFTDRPGDIDDCISLAQTAIDWDAMLQEIKDQITLSKEPIWITYIGERLDLLEEKNIAIPIMSSINKLRDDFMDTWEKEQTKLDL